jgi:dTDP-4-amino-4,6-dideoxygalactose transaminase
MSKLALFGGSPVRTTPLPAWPVFDEAERLALAEVLESRSWGGYSPKVKEFETSFAAAHDCRFGVSAVNGTLTLESALLASGIGPGAEVIVPPITFIATATAVLRTGATPVFADIDPKTYNLDPARVEEAINARTRALIPVHFAGHPADMDALMPLARKHDLVVIEDCAHAHGASWRARKVGSFGDFGSFSFQESKNMTAGEGGILVTNDADRAGKAWAFANQGRIPGGAWYQHESLGTNLRLTGFQAALLSAQLARLPEQLRAREQAAAYLTSQLRDSGVLAAPEIDPRVTRHGLYLFMLRLNSERLGGASKTHFLEALAAEGISGASSYPHPLYRNRVFENYQSRSGDCPEAERMCEEAFWVSHQVLLADRQGLDDFVAAVEKIARHADQLCAHAG